MRVGRVLAVSAIAAVAIVVAALLTLHTTTVQSRILAWSIAELERRFDLDLEADALDFNLATRRVVMRNVRLAAIGHGDNPFFTASAVTVRLPWAVYRGRLSFDEINVHEGRVTITRDRNGISNLPPGRGRRDPNAPPRRLDVRGLVVRNLDFTYYDYSRDVEIRAPAVRTDLAYVLGKGARGPFAIERDMLVRLGARRFTVAPVTGGMTFTGSDVELEKVSLKTREGHLFVSGPITRVLDRPTLDLTLDGTADLERAALLFSSPIHVGGSAAIDATMKGAPSEFVLDAHVVSKAAEIGDEPRVAIDAVARLTPQAIRVSRGVLHPATGGRVDTELAMPFGNVPWSMTAAWQGLDAAAAFRLAEVDPLPFGAAFEGTLRLDRRPGEPYRLTVHNESTARAARGTAPTAGVVDFEIAGNTWSADQRHRMGATLVDGRIGGVWNRQSAANSTLRGNLTVRSGDVGEAARHAALFGFTAPAIVREARGPLDADVTLDGRLNAPRFVGKARTTGVEIAGMAPMAFTADFDASARALNVTNIDATTGKSTLRGEVFANFVNRQLAGALHLDTPSAGELLGALPPAARLEGPLAATVNLAGTVDRPEIDGTIVGTGLTLAGQPVDSIAAKARLVGQSVEIDSFALTQQGSGVVRGSGRYSWVDRSYAVDLQGQDLTWRGTIARLGNAQARFSLKFAGAGTLDRLGGEGALEYEVTGGLAESLIGKGTANVRLNGETALVTAHVPSLGAFVTATITPRQPFAYDAVVVMNRIDLEQVVTLAGLQQGHVKGTASLSATAKGVLEDITSSTVFVNLQDIGAEVAGVGIALASPSRLAWDGKALTVDALDLTVGKGRLLAAGRLGEGGVASWDSSYRGNLADAVRIGRLFGLPIDLDASGPVDLNWRSTGGIDASTASVRIDGGTVAWQRFPEVRNLTVDGRFDGKTVEITKLTGEWQGGGIEGSASIPRSVLQATARPVAGAGTGHARLRVIGLTEAAFAPWLSRETLARIGARFSASLDAEITRPSLEGVSGNITLDEANLLVAGVQVQQVRPSRFVIREGVVRAEDVAWDAEGSTLSLSGTAALGASETAKLALEVKGVADLRILSAFAPTVATGGTAKLNVGVGGTVAAPIFSGRLDVADGEMLIREPRVFMSDLSGTIALDGQRVLFDNFNGNANGGTILFDGGFLLKGFAIAGGQLAIGISQAALEYPRGLQSEADAVLTLRPTGENWTLTGDIRVARSIYAETINIAALAANRRTRAPSAINTDRWIDRLRLNLFVVTQEDVRIDNNYGRFEAGGAIRVGGTATNPVLGGRVTLREGGEVFLGGRRFYISRGNISFDSPNRIDPELDIELRTLVSGADITVTLEGTLDKLTTDVRSSDPTIDSREAMAMLFGGLSGENAATLLSAELLGVTGRALGLDALRVERGFESEEFRADPGLIATETDPATRLTLSKRIRPEVELIISQNLRESGGISAIVSYKPRRNLELRAVSRDDTDRSIALRHEITFGGSGSGGPASRSEQPEIAAIRILGELGRPAAELTARLKLDVGNRFDFHQWQRDIDRLREAYHERGHYEVRVRPTREPAETPNAVVLEYRIEPGPVSELVIQGHQLHPELEEEIRDAWKRTIFDRFLAAEVEERVTRDLIAENIVGSKVTATIANVSPNSKRLTVNVAAGTPVEKRELRFAGNFSFDAGELNGVVADAGLDIAGWTEPDQIAAAIQEFYRQEGFLSATVSTSDPSVQGGIGVLPVAIDEGPRFSIGNVAFTGVAADREDEMRTTSGFGRGGPYRSEDLAAASRRVEEAYARQGFNAATVDTHSRQDDTTQTVDVTFTVQEGQRQVLREVVTEGATRTREGVVDRALRLRVGDPVDLRAWSQARKRMYDTNVFRQVDIVPTPLPETAEDTAAGIQPVRAVVRVVEYPLWRLRYGLQLNDDKMEFEDPDGDSRQQSLGLLTEIRNQNLFGLAYTTGIAGRYDRDRQSANLFVSNSSFFGLPVRNQGFVFLSRQRLRVEDRVISMIDRFGISAEQRWRPFTGSEVFYSYRFTREHHFDPDPSPFDPFPLDVRTKVARLTGTFLLDKRDNPFEPTKGWFHSDNWDQSVPMLGSDASYARLLTQQYYFLPLGRLVLASRAQLGRAFGGTLPFGVDQRFMAGGGISVRGYADNSLGPRDVFNVPTGGESMLVLNQEARFPVRWWVQGVAFVDAGNVFADRSISLTSLKVGYGVGLRLDTPFLMFRLDYGLPASRLESVPDVRRRGRWTFGIGHIF